MKAIQTSTSTMAWQDGSAFYGPRSVVGGRPLVHVKVLSDRREAGGGIAYLVKLSPPPGKLIKIVAVARSDEHIYILEGGYCNKSGKQLRGLGDYGFNPAGHPHSAFIGDEIISLVVYSGEPDEIVDFDVVDVAGGQS